MSTIKIIVPPATVLVDEVDAERITEHKWWLSESRSGVFYAYTQIGGCTVYMHRFILRPPRGVDVDHRNHNGLDNRRGNLRLASRSQNMANARPRGGSSRYKGVYWRKDRGKWAAEAWVNGKKNYLGLHEEEDAAARAYDVFALRQWGEFAIPNLLRVA